mmetsp:Transcript_29259/g.57442  ORF Transcript_29259/g.57442 Transcript_29259/m.57442 type:complete len:249 (+) Transcript_29259:891-1637(+)
MPPQTLGVHNHVMPSRYQQQQGRELHGLPPRTPSLGRAAFHLHLGHAGHKRVGLHMMHWHQGDLESCSRLQGVTHAHLQAQRESWSHSHPNCRKGHSPLRHTRSLQTPLHCALYRCRMGLSGHVRFHPPEFLVHSLLRCDLMGEDQAVRPHHCSSRVVTRTLDSQNRKRSVTREHTPGRGRGGVCREGRGRACLAPPSAQISARGGGRSLFPPGPQLGTREVLRDALDAHQPAETLSPDSAHRNTQTF